MPYKDKEKQREAQRKWEKENRGAGKRHKVWMFIFYPDTAEVGWRDENNDMWSRALDLKCAWAIGNFIERRRNAIQQAAKLDYEKRRDNSDETIV